MTARPTGVPLTADNVADADECRDKDGTHVRIGPDAWRLAGTTGSVSDEAMVFTAHAYGTVVTKWMKE